jgi:GNAT superfamily N-acetyltransferase
VNDQAEELMMAQEYNVVYNPLTTDRWSDFEELFGAKGAYGGCWCMWWRLPRRQFESQQGEQNRLAMKAIVDSGKAPGIIGYLESRPIAWCAVAPREEYGALNRSRVLKPIDDRPVWSIVCFYMAKAYRHSGLLEGLIAAAVDHARQQGGSIVEAYPTVVRSKKAPPTSTYMGFPEVFERVGFVECAQPSASKRIMRCSSPTWRW